MCSLSQEINSCVWFSLFTFEVPSDWTSQQVCMGAISNTGERNVGKYVKTERRCSSQRPSPDRRCEGGGITAIVKTLTCAKSIWKNQDLSECFFSQYGSRVLLRLNLWQNVSVCRKKKTNKQKKPRIKRNIASSIYFIYWTNDELKVLQWGFVVREAMFCARCCDRYVYQGSLLSLKPTLEPARTEKRQFLSSGDRIFGVFWDKNRHHFNMCKL